MDKVKELFVVRATSTENDEYIITLGNKIASNQRFKTAKEAQQFINSKPYELMMTLCFASIEAWEKSKEEEEKENQKKEG